MSTALINSNQVLAEESIERRWRIFYDNSMLVDRDHFWHVVRNERIYSLLKMQDPLINQKSFLEIGSGSANVVGSLWESGISCATGWELVPYAVELSSKRYPQINFVQSNFLTGDHPDHNFDVIGMFDFLEHVENDIECLAKARNLLHRGGRLVLTVPAMPSLWSQYDTFMGHYKRYCRNHLNDTLKASGFRPEKTIYFMAPLVPLLLISRKDSNLSDEEMEELYRRESGMPNRLLNKAAKFVMRMEHNVLRDRDLGFGASLIAIASKD